MTHEEAKKVVAIALAGSVARDTDGDTLKFWRSHLLPLPYEAIARRVHGYVATHKWCASLAELLEACGLPDAARHDLVRAVREGGQLVPDLRSLSGWSYVAPGEPLPQGAIEAAAVASAAPPGKAGRGASSGSAADPERAAEVLARVRGIAAAKRVERVALPPPAVLEQDLAAADARFRAALAEAERGAS